MATTESTAISHAGAPATGERQRWLALFVLCAGQLMIIIDATIVNVALPVIKANAGFTDATLTWVVNAYLIAFASTLLLAGRAGDLFGHRRLLLGGLALFTLASLGCGLTSSSLTFLLARAVQGLGGGVVGALSLAVMLTLFQEPAGRARALSAWSFVASGGASAGVLAGGLITQVLDWHWIFLVNLPIGIVACALTVWLVPADPPWRLGQRLDVPGAVTMTAAIALAVFGIVHASDAGWGSPVTLASLGAAMALGILFVVIESRAGRPLVPLAIFGQHRFMLANLLLMLAFAGLFSFFFFSTLYLKQVRGFSSLQTGLIYLPATVTIGIFSQGAAARGISRFGATATMAAGLALMIASLALFAAEPPDAGILTGLLPAMLLFGLGGGLGFPAVFMIGTENAGEADAGLVSGLLNTFTEVGGAVGLALVVSVNAAFSAAGQLAGLRAAFVASMVLLTLAALILLPLRGGGATAPAGPLSAR
jgi:EmrB/QacA subfamily drug resistance transporter